MVMEKKKRGRPRRNLVTNIDSEKIVENKVSNAKTIRDPLLEPFHIAMDSYCYTVVEKINTDNDTSYLKSIGFFSNFGSCLNKIAKLKVNDKSYSSIKDYINEYETILNNINKLIEI